MTTAREIMTPDATCVRSSDTVFDAARLMAAMSVGSLPICGEDNRLQGMLTDRDIVVKVIAEGREPRGVRAGELAEGAPVTIDADDDAQKILRTMKEHKIRRLPVLDNQQLVGIIAQADVARTLDKTQVGDLLDVLSRD
jgi:CBS domain-containing protein